LTLLENLWENPGEGWPSAYAAEGEEAFTGKEHLFRLREEPQHEKFLVPDQKRRKGAPPSYKQKRRPARHPVEGA